MAKTNSGLLEFKDDQKVLIALDDATSEVKKAVIIDADGTETDIAGGGGGVTVEALSVTENGTYSEEGKAYSPVTVNVAGGSGDFSTAEVSVTYNGPDTDIYAKVACVEDNTIISGTFIDQSTTKVLTVPIASGGAIIDFDELSSQSYVISGDIEGIDNPDLSPFLITGDCTISVSAPK